MLEFNRLNDGNPFVVGPLNITYIEGVYDGAGAPRGVRLVMDNGHTHEVKGEFREVADKVQLARDAAVGLK